jgi:hypothetical protein
MPPPIEETKRGLPPGSGWTVSFDVERIAAPVGEAQMFRFSVVIYAVDNLLPRGGKLSIVRNKMNTSPEPAKLPKLFSKTVPSALKLSADEKQMLAYLAEVKVKGKVPVATSSADLFVLQWEPKSTGTNREPMKELKYTNAIAAF